MQQEFDGVEIIVRLHEQRRVGLEATLVNAVHADRFKFVILQADCIHFVLRILILITVCDHRRGSRVVHVQQPGIIVGLTVDRARAHAEHQRSMPLFPP